MSNFRDNQLQSNENVMSFVPIVQFMFKMSQEDSCTQRQASFKGAPAASF